MTSEGWELHPWATDLHPGGIIGTRDPRDWKRVTGELQGQYDLDRAGAWVRIVDDGPRVAVFLNSDVYSQQMVSEALRRLKPRIRRCLEEGPGVDDAWEVSVGADGRFCCDMVLQYTTADQAGLFEALETIEMLETIEGREQ